MAAVLASHLPESDLPPGSAKPIKILGEQFTLYRGQSGACHLVAFACAHRGTQLSIGWVDPPEYLPCSFWNRIDNDAAHGAWTHRSSALRMNRPDFLIQRRDDVEETGYGYIQRREGFSSGHVFMPNGRLFWIKTRARGYEGRQDLVDTKLSWTVPVDDERLVAFDVTVSPLDGEDARAYAEQRSREQEPEADSRWDIAEKILAGEMTIEDIPDDVSHYNGFVIEDYVTQVGQGRLADRAKERLGSADARVIINRKLWLRELTALAEGRPLTDWQVPEQPLRPPPGTRFV